VAKPLPVDFPFSDHAIIDEDDGHAPVVEAVQLGIGVDVAQLRLDLKLSEEAEGLITEVAALAGD